MVEKTLIPGKNYLETGSHIGAKFKTKGMAKFIFKKRSDKLKVMDVSTIDARIKMAADFLSKFEAEEIIAVSQKEYGWKAVNSFAKVTGAKANTGRFIPGTFTNPLTRYFVEPKAIIVTDPKVDHQAIQEAAVIGISTIGFCSTDNETRNLDLIIPINNKGRQSIALAYWLLAREILRNKGKIANYEEFTAKLEDFEVSLEAAKSVKEHKKTSSRFEKNKFDRKNRRRTPYN